MEQPKEPRQVWVYLYTFWDAADAKQERTSGQYATLETIKMGLGIADLASGIKVNQQEVVEGMYVPRRQAASSA
jgi:hypothetical protein